MNILSRKGDKIGFYHDLGRAPGQRPSTGIFIYTKPKDQIQKNHNKEALALLETKKSQLIIERQAIASSFIPSHKFKSNFLEYFEQYVEQNKRKANRHLSNSLKQFKLFINSDFIAPIDITENFCKRFRQYLLDKFMYIEEVKTLLTTHDVSTYQRIAAKVVSVRSHSHFYQILFTNARINNL